MLYDWAWSYGITCARAYMRVDDNDDDVCLRMRVCVCVCARVCECNCLTAGFYMGNGQIRRHFGFFS